MGSWPASGRASGWAWCKPWATRAITDDLAHPQDGLARLVVVIGAGVFATLAAGLVGVLPPFQTATISQSIMFDLRRQLFGRLMTQSVGFFTSRAGDLLSRINNDIDGIQDVASDTVFGLVISLVIAVSTVGCDGEPELALTLAGWP